MHGTENIKIRMEYITSGGALCFVKKYNFLSHAPRHEVVNPWSIGGIVYLHALGVGSGQLHASAAECPGEP